MVSRLVLGCGAVGQRLVEAAAGDDASLRVVTTDEGRVEALRGENIRAEHADPTEVSVLRSAGPADVVLVVESDPDRALTIVERAREAFPAATVVAYLPLGADDADRRALSAAADRTIDARGTVARGVVDLVASPAGQRTRRLRATLQSIEGQLAVVMHDNPDPDAIGAAVALACLAESLGVDAVPCYYGAINHQENRALVNLLGLELRKLDPEEDPREFGGIALVDHSRPGVNDQLPPDIAVDIVIDHHPPREPMEARFVDLRSEAGATSTLLTDYLRRFGVPECGGGAVATALLYGIRVDTSDFTREVSEADFQAAGALLPHADTDVLDRVESPDVTPETMNTFGRAAHNREVRGDVLAAPVDRVRDRDTLAQAADRLLDLDGVSTTLVYGYDETTVYLSVRSRGTSLDLGETLRVAFDDLGSAGGHADMAGAQLPLEVVLDAAEDLDLDPGVGADGTGADGDAAADGGDATGDDPSAGGESVPVADDADVDLDPDPDVDEVPRGSAAGPARPGADGAGDGAAEDARPDDDAGGGREAADEPSPAPDAGLHAEDERTARRVRAVVSGLFFDAVRDRPRERPDDTGLPGATFDADYVPATWGSGED